MPFTIRIKVNYDWFTYPVEQLPSDANFDYFKVIGKNGAMILKCNQPILNRLKLRHKRAKWEVVTGQIWNKYAEEKIVY